MTPMQFIVREVVKRQPVKRKEVGHPARVKNSEIADWLAKHSPATTRQICEKFGIAKSGVNEKLRQIGALAVKLPDGNVLRSIR